MREDKLEHGQQFFNTYEQSTCEAERLVRDHADRLPVVIFRRSLIIGDSRSGYTTLFNAIYIPLRLLDRGVRFVTPAAFNERRRHLSGRSAALAEGLDTLFRYVTTNRLFDTSSADSLLRSSGIVFPRFSAYADRISDFCLRTRWGKRPAVRAPATG